MGPPSFIYISLEAASQARGEVMGQSFESWKKVWPVSESRWFELSELREVSWGGLTWDQLSEVNRVNWNGVSWGELTTKQQRGRNESESHRPKATIASRATSGPLGVNIKSERYRIEISRGPKATQGDRCGGSNDRPSQQTANRPGAQKQQNMPSTPRATELSELSWVRWI